jgi:hypothetical protein
MLLICRIVTVAALNMTDALPQLSTDPRQLH